MTTIKQKVHEASEVVRAAWQQTDARADEKPSVVITTGSGLGALVEKLDPLIFEISYADIPYLPPSRIVGHAGRLVIGHYGGPEGKKVIVLDGRIHGYEGHAPLVQVLPLLIAHQLCGEDSLALFTNAAGAINEDYAVGQLMLISDHINFTGETLLVLSEETDFGEPSMDMSFAYTPALREAFAEVARQHGQDVAEGVYIGVKGAQFETPAEIRAFRMWGADAVGMSTVHEVAAASRLGMRTLGVSVLTNMAAGIIAQPLTHEEVIETTAQTAHTLSELIEDFLEVV